MIRDIGSGFKASYEVTPDGMHHVNFFRNGRKIYGRVFKQQGDALMAFTATTRLQLVQWDARF